MSHADTLRGMAKGPHSGLSYSGVVALIAGAEALDARDRVREALDRVNQECGRYPTPAPGQRHSPYNAGYLDGLAQHTPGSTKP